MGVPFDQALMIFTDNYVKIVNFVNLDNPMGQLYWMYPEGCNSHWGGKPLSPIRLKPFKLLITYIYLTIFLPKMVQNLGK